MRILSRPLYRPALALCLLIGGGVLAAGVDNRLAQGMYSSRRAWAPGDLLTVNVSEQTVASKQQGLKMSKSMSAKTGTNTLGYSNTALQEKEYRRLPLGKGVSLPGYSLDAASEFDGSGSTSSAESLDAAVTVQVVEVLPNAVLVVRGERLVVRNREQVNMVLTGLVRQQDVTADNTVQSSQLASARIRYESTGTVSQGSNPGWFWRLFTWVNPF